MMNTTPTCLKCKRECDVEFEVEWEPYEFWGQRGVHRWENEKSSCCAAEVEHKVLEEEVV